jgi:hypothetical protein
MELTEHIYPNQKTQANNQTESLALTMPPGSIFELVDNTSQETYFTMGLFLTLDDAINAVKDISEPPTDDPEEYAKLEIRERCVGKLTWWDNGKNVATLEWHSEYSDELEDWKWEGPKITLSNAQDQP